MTTPPDLDAVLADMRAYIERKVAEGFDSQDDIAQQAVDVFSDDADAQALEEVAGGYVKRALSAHRKAAAAWPDETDCDRLDAAFRHLEESGIVARQHFTCCGTCGHAEIGGEIDAARQRRISARGYTFYHMQDTEAAADGQGLYLAYGDLEQSQEEALRIGREVVTTLERFGFQPRWNGEWNTRIHVPMRWQRRFRLPRDAAA